MSELKDIYWMASPLAIDQRNNLNDKGHKTLKPLARYIDPRNEIHVFRKIEHWTLEIDGRCYELTPDSKKKLNLIKKTTDMIKPHCLDATHWREMRERKEIKPEKRKVGRTRKTHDEIQAEVKYIWTTFNNDWYGFFTQNCQNFAHMLFERVALPNAEEGLWDSIPDPIGYRLADSAKLALASKAAYGTQAAYLTAVATSQGVEAAGTIGATSGGTVSGGTAAAGSTGTTGHVGIGAKAAGLMHGGHIGIGAKAAALTHGGHAATIGSGMVKAGALAAYAHPVTGVALTGGLAYLAIRGKKGKRWSKKNKKSEDMDVLDLLVNEEEAFEQAENSSQEEKDELLAESNNTDQEAGEILAEELLAESYNAHQDVDENVAAKLLAESNNADQEIDENLAEELNSGLVTSEPGTLTEEDESVTAVKDPRREQTTG